MPRPRKSTRDEWIDQFDGWSIEDQENALELVEFVHRKAKRMAAREQVNRDRVAGEEPKQEALL